jgi:glucosamine-phosphate N-acetyltransferase
MTRTFPPSSQRFKIRPCRRKDFAAVVQLLRQLWPDTHLETAALRNVYERNLRAKSQVYLCAFDGKNACGFASLTTKNNLWQAGKVGHIDELVVDERYRGCGLGTQLLNEIIAHAKQRGCVRVELDSAFHRNGAHEFYRRHDFEKRAYVFSKRLG